METETEILANREKTEILTDRKRERKRLAYRDLERKKGTDRKYGNTEKEKMPTAKLNILRTSINFETGRYASRVYFKF